jgi:hypothetical protein
MIKEDGTRCGGPTMSGRRFCYFHDDDPQTVKARASAASRGGKRSRSKDGLASWTVRPITTMEDLKTSLSELFNAGMSGEITTARLSALASVANALGKVIEQSDLEKRIEALEIKAGEMRA